MAVESIQRNKKEKSMFSDNMIRTDKKQGTEIRKRDVLLRVKPLVDI